MSASEQRAGVLAVVSAYSVWGVTPIYYKWVEFAGPLEVSAHRIVWALLMLMGLGCMAPVGKRIARPHGVLQGADRPNPKV